MLRSDSAASHRSCLASNRCLQAAKADIDNEMNGEGLWFKVFDLNKVA